MNRTDIIRMAREAGFGIGQGIGPLRINGYADDLERFAALVARAEREECAQVAAATVCDTHLPTGLRIYGTRAAAAIRARGNA